MIAIKLDVTKLDKTRFFKGEKGTYAGLIIIETPGGKFGDYMVKQQCSKEERESGTEMPILGNGKNLGGKTPSKPQKQQQSRPEPQDDDDIPF